MSVNASASRLSRRQLIQSGVAGLAGMSLGATATHAAEAAAHRKRATRFAFLTDIHVQPECGGGEGLAQCLRHAQSLADPIDFIITGGDSVMDVFYDVKPERCRVLEATWRRVLRQELSVPAYHCIGNHDVWGWSKPGGDPKAGKAWIMNLYGQSHRYFAFERDGWRFILLDSMFQVGDDKYIGKLDDEQRTWLNEQLTLDAGTQPIVIISHIPILTVTSLMYDTQRVADGSNHIVPGTWMHIDAAPLHDLLREHPNVKLCLSGHIHLLDRCEVDSVTYICGGAVCGNWWEGDLQKVDEGYSVVDLYDDGSFDCRYLSYGWQVEPA